MSNVDNGTRESLVGNDPTSESDAESCSSSESDMTSASDISNLDSDVADFVLNTKNQTFMLLNKCTPFTNDTINIIIEYSKEYFFQCSQCKTNGATLKKKSHCQEAKEYNSYYDDWWINDSGCYRICLCPDCLEQFPDRCCACDWGDTDFMNADNSCCPQCEKSYCIHHMEIDAHDCPQTIVNNQD